MIAAGRLEWQARWQQLVQGVVRVQTERGEQQLLDSLAHPVEPTMLAFVNAHAMNSVVGSKKFFHALMAADLVLRVVDPARVEVVATVPVADAPRVRSDASARIVDAPEGTPALRVVARAAAVQPGTTLVPVRLAFASPAAFPVGAPVQVAPEMEVRDQATTTETDGAVWTSTMLGLEQCPVLIAADWSECGRWAIEADAGDGFPLVGEWWAVKGPGFAAFQFPSENGQWQLTSQSCDGECDGDW